MTQARLHIPDAPDASSDRRSERRQVAVLRAALIDINGQTHFCRIVNVSSHGAELRLYQLPAADDPLRPLLRFFRDRATRRSLRR